MLQQAENGEAALPIIVDSYRIDLPTAKMLLRRLQKTVLVIWLVGVTVLAAISIPGKGRAGVHERGVYLVPLTLLLVIVWIRRRRLPLAVARDHPLLMLACGQLNVEQKSLQDAPLRVEVPAATCRIRRLRKRSATERDFTEVQVPLPPAWLLGPTLHVPVYDGVPGAREFCRALRSAGARRLPRCGVLRYYWRETFLGAPCVDVWQRHLLHAGGVIMAVFTILQALFPQNPEIGFAWFLGSVLATQSVFTYRKLLSARRRSRSNGLILQPAQEPSGDSGGLAAV